MTYTLLGNKDFVIKELNSILKDYQKEEISTYDLEENTIKEVLDDLNTISLFGKKIVIVYNLDKLSDDKELGSYLEHEGSNTLVLISYKELDNRKKISKILKDKTKLKELFNFNVTDYIKNSLDDYKMDFMTIKLLISYTSSNINRIDKELDKLKMYKLKDKVITSDDVKKLVKRSYDSTIFNLIDYINNKDKKNIYKVYEELKKEGETPDKIMYTIANHYRLLFQIKNLCEEKSDKEVQSIYNLHPYRFSKLKEQAYLMSNDSIIYILKSLGDIDIKVKMGKGEIDTLLILFFEDLK